MVRALRVLIVDDGQDLREMLGFALELSGYQVSTAACGEEALEAAARACPDVVLLDLGLPDLNGCDVFRALRALPRLTDLRGVAVTGWGRAEDRRRTAAAGFRWHVVKPAKLEELLAILAEVAAEIGVSQTT